MKRLLAWGIPATLAVAGIILIIIGTRGTDGGPTSSLPPIAEPSSQVAQASPTPEPTAATATATATASEAPEATATPTPLPASTVAVQLEIPSVGVNVLIQQSQDAATDDFPPRDTAYILQGSSQPGQNNNSYIFAHATASLFKPMWNVQLGAEVTVLMSDDSVRRYVVTEVRPNVPCPDPEANPAQNPTDPPLVLQLHDTCDEGIFWIQNTGYERLTLQTSQGFNRNWGEFIVIADPAG